MNNSQPTKSTLLVAWTVVILASSLPKVVLQEIFGKTVSADQQAVMSLSVILVALLVTLIERPLRGLWPLLGLFTVLIGSQWLVYSRIDELANYPIWLHHPSFNFSMLSEESLNIMVTLLVIAALLLMGKKPKDFYLAIGDLAAPVEPIRWLGVKEGDRWNKFGIWLSVFISLGTLTFLVIGGRPPLDIVIKALPFLPAILLAAAINSFTEEITYKASFLSVLESPVGKRQAVYMVAAYFGLMHYYGIPYGVIGVLLAAFMGWLLAKSMQETRGLFWAWFIHFLQDVWIFAFLAIGSIIPGGG
jgi:membrane protease YdiL (CAAX protease family)